MAESERLSERARPVALEAPGVIRVEAAGAVVAVVDRLQVGLVGLPQDADSDEVRPPELDEK